MAQASTIAGGVKSPALAIVSADQTTIGGDGTTENPLHAIGGGGGSYETAWSQFQALPAPGTVVEFRTSGGSQRLAPGDRCTGMVVAQVATLEYQVQTTGVVELTAAEWALVTNDAAALNPGDIYFGDLSSDGKIFHGVLTPTTTVVQIGIALSATELLLQISLPFVVP